jgi:hypothetical protein
LDNFTVMGVDEILWKPGQRYLTVAHQVVHHAVHQIDAHGKRRCKA